MNVSFASVQVPLTIVKYYNQQSADWKRLGTDGTSAKSYIVTHYIHLVCLMP